MRMLSKENALHTHTKPKIHDPMINSVDAALRIHWIISNRDIDEKLKSNFSLKLLFPRFYFLTFSMRNNSIDRPNFSSLTLFEINAKLSSLSLSLALYLFSKSRFRFLIFSSKGIWMPEGKIIITISPAEKKNNTTTLFVLTHMSIRSNFSLQFNFPDFQAVENGIACVFMLFISWRNGGGGKLRVFLKAPPPLSL